VGDLTHDGDHRCGVKQRVGVRIDDPRGGELGFLFVFKTLMRNLNKVNLHNSRSPNSSNTS
jgi:hypothetical protein